MSALGTDNQNSTVYLTDEFVVAYIKHLQKNKTAKNSILKVQAIRL